MVSSAFVPVNNFPPVFLLLVSGVGKVVDERLSVFGAKRLVELGLGEDNKYQDADFYAWKERLWPILDAILQHDAGILPNTNSIYIPEHKVEIHEPGTKLFERRIGQFMMLKIRESTGLKYQTGDHVAIYAENHKEYVEEASKLLGQPLDLIFSLHDHRDESLSFPFPGSFTLEAALSRYSDFLSPPKKSELMVLAACASVKEEGDRLRLLASPSGRQEFIDYILDSKRTLLEVMSDFPSVKVPPGVLLRSSVTCLEPRFYSISSSPNSAPGRIHVTYALILGTSASGKVFRGVSFTWMKNASPGEEGPAKASWALVYVQTSNFWLPLDPKAPLVMVGPSAGLAPSRESCTERLRDFIKWHGMYIKHF
ncbi:hypothetical protein R1flu_008983 [Riccia fluitans]|uniref:FAD-binding FR-type domain-containing protein n=1 Tax=Riccia fluitans TaxID=41844 RepID=A0ABD1Z0S4_9MARC